MPENKFHERKTCSQNCGLNCGTKSYTYLTNIMPSAGSSGHIQKHSRIHAQHEKEPTRQNTKGKGALRWYVNYTWITGALTSVLNRPANLTQFKTIVQRNTCRSDEKPPPARLLFCLLRWLRFCGCGFRLFCALAPVAANQRSNVSFRPLNGAW